MRLILAVGLLAAAATPAAAQIEGRVRRVGLFEGGDPIVRAGCQAALVVELRWIGNTPFDGELRINRQDRDGDVIASAQRVQLPPDAEWHTFEVYFTPIALNNTDVVSARLFDAEGRQISLRTDAGEEVKSLDSPLFSSLPPEELLVVDLTSPRKLPHAAWLDRRRYESSQPDKVFSRRVRSMNPADLPARWQGLEMVDAIIWDDADPSALGVQQTQALVEWVENGGRLLITSGKNWQLLAASPLAESLPVRIEGVEPAEDLDAFLALVRSTDYEQKLRAQYKAQAIARCLVQPISSKMIPVPARGVAEPMAWRRILGRGSVAFLAAPLEQLLPAPAGLRNISDEMGSKTPDRDDPYLLAVERVIGATLLGLTEPREWQGNSPFDFQLNVLDLFDIVRRTIDFGSLSTAFLIFAFLFTGAYALASLGGTWWYLRRKNMPQHTWSAFCVMAVLGGVVGMALVISLRGFSTQVWQTCVIDMREGEDYARAMCLFGVKTPDHTQLDVRLPVGFEDDDARQAHGLLRPTPRLTMGVQLLEDTFVAPERYRAERDMTWLEDVPVRATLKEFQGQWHGPIGSALNARLVVPRRPEDEDQKRAWFGKGSFIRNNLGFALRDCYILEINDDIAGGSTGRLVRCHPIGTLEKDETLEGAAIEERLYYPPAGTLASTKPRTGPEMLLTHVAQQWRTRLGGLSFGAGTPAGQAAFRGGADSAALLLLSCYDLLDTNSQGIYATTRGPGRLMGCSHLITARTALLVGFSDEACGPQLEIDGVKQKARRSFNMYRFVIPVERE